MKSMMTLMIFLVGFTSESFATSFTLSSSLVLSGKSEKSIKSFDRLLDLGGHEIEQSPYSRPMDTCLISLTNMADLPQASTVPTGTVFYDDGFRNRELNHILRGIGEIRF